MAERQILIDFSELSAIEVSCKKCRASVVLPAETTFKDEGRCQSCGESLFGAAVAVKAFRGFMKEARDSGHAFKFRIVDG